MEGWREGGTFAVSKRQRIIPFYSLVQLSSALLSSALFRPFLSSSLLSSPLRCSAIGRDAYIFCLKLTPLFSFFLFFLRSRCNAQLGWTYIAAFEESQKYKVGKFIIEKANMMRDSDWLSARNGRML